MYSHSATTQRVEQLRKARNINEIVAVLKDIASDIKLLGPKVDKFTESISSAPSLKGRLLKELVAAYVPQDADPIHASSRLVVSPELAQRFRTRVSKSATSDPGTNTDEFVVVRDGSKVDFTPTGTRDPDSPRRSPTKRRSGVEPYKLGAKFSVPPIDVLIKHNDVLNGMLESTMGLKYAIQLLETGEFPEAQRKAALQAIQLLFKAADTRISAAFEALNALSSKGMPKPMKDLSSAIVKYLEKRIPEDRYEHAPSYYQHVSPHGTDGSILFSFHLAYEHLKTDSGFIFDKYYVVLTGIVDRKSLRIWLNTMPEFKLHYPLGTEVSKLPEKTVMTYLDEFLAQNDVSLELDRQAMPLGQRDTAKFSRIKGVKRASVAGDRLLVSLLPAFESGEAQQGVAANLMLAINTAVGNKTKKSKVAYKVIRKNGVTYLEFYMINRGESKKIGKDTLHDLQEMLGLTDRQVQIVREAQRTID